MDVLPDDEEFVEEEEHVVGGDGRGVEMVMGEEHSRVFDGRVKEVVFECMPFCGEGGVKKFAEGEFFG